MKHRRTREIIIELTSLLDVVMILIFAVLLQNAELLEKKNQQIAKAESEYTSIKGELDEALGEKDKLLDEKDKLAGELQEALEKLDKDNIGELWDKLEKYENIAEALEALESNIYVYYFSVESCSINDSFKYADIVQGTLNGEEKKNRIYASEDDGVLNGDSAKAWGKITADIWFDITKDIPQEQESNQGDRYYYVVFSCNENNININTWNYLHDDFLNRLIEHYKSNTHVFITYNKLGGK